MKTLLIVLSLSALSFAGVGTFSAKHVVVPVAKASAKAVKTSAKASVKAVKVAKKVVY